MDEEGKKPGPTSDMKKEQPLIPGKESDSPDVDIVELRQHTITYSTFHQHVRPFMNPSELEQANQLIDNLVEQRTSRRNQSTLRITIGEEPLTAQTLSTIIAAVTDLHARCFFIQLNRLTDLMDYAQTRDPRFLKEANLQVGILSHNSPTLIDFFITSGWATTLAFALKRGIDAVLQTPLRYEEARLKNEREKLNQKIAAEKAEAEKRTSEQEQKIAAKEAQIELDKQQIELDRQRLQFQQDRVKIIIEISAMVVSQLQSDNDAGQREMIIHSLVPPFLQLATIDSLVTATTPEPIGEGKKESSEDK